MTEIRVRPRSRTLVSRPCNSAWSVTAPAKCSCAVVLPGEGEAAEPGRPVLVEVSLDTELVAQGCVGVVRHGQDLTAAAGCVVMFLRAVLHSE